jgi:3'-phosphoadenosine 5'-phosphosulfate (PAPS) 3'-phosphatase
MRERSQKPLAALSEAKPLSLHEENGKTVYVDPVGGGKRFTDLTQYARAIALSYPTGKE